MAQIKSTINSNQLEMNNYALLIMFRGGLCHLSEQDLCMIIHRLKEYLNHELNSFLVDYFAINSTRRESLYIFLIEFASNFHWKLPE